MPEKSARSKVRQMAQSSWLPASLLLVAATFTVLLVFQAPIWVHVVLESPALALLYIVARLRSRYDPLDPRFGSCIPPIYKPRNLPLR